MVIIVHKITQFVSVLRIFGHTEKPKPKKPVKRKQNIHCVDLNDNNISE